MCLFLIILVLIFALFSYSPTIGAFCLVGAIIIFVIVAVNNDNERQKEEEERENKQRQYKEATQNRLDARIQAVSQKYGSPDKLIKLSEYRYIAVFAKSQIICISDTEIAFNEIMSAKIIDNYQIEHGQITGDATTTTSTSSLVGRSAAGAIIGGGIGAAIGASSASKNTTVNYTQSNDKLIHDYVLIITLNRFNSSIIKVRIGNNWERAAEIEHIFNLINIHNQQTAQ